MVPGRPQSHIPTTSSIATPPRNRSLLATTGVWTLEDVRRERQRALAHGHASQEPQIRASPSSSFNVWSLQPRNENHANTNNNVSGAHLSLPRSQSIRSTESIGSNYRLARTQQRLIDSEIRHGLTTPPPYDGHGSHRLGRIAAPLFDDEDSIEEEEEEGEIEVNLDQDLGTLEIDDSARRGATGRKSSSNQVMFSPVAVPLQRHTDAIGSNMNQSEPFGLPSINSPVVGFDPVLKESHGTFVVLEDAKDIELEWQRKLMKSIDKADHEHEDFVKSLQESFHSARSKTMQTHTELGQKRDESFGKTNRQAGVVHFMQASPDTERQRQIADIQLRHARQRAEVMERLADIQRVESAILEKKRQELEEQRLAELAEEARKKEAIAQAKKEELHQKIKEVQLEKKKQEADAKRQVELAQRRENEEEYNYGPKAAKAEADRVEALIVEVQRNAQIFEQDKNQGRDRMEIKKLVNKAINQISASQKQVLLKMQELLHALKVAKGMGPAALAFCEKTIAERILIEAEGQIMLHAQSSFPVAAVCAALMAQYPTMRDLIVAHFHRACKMTVPMHLQKAESMTDHEYSLAMGMKPNEEVSAFHDRMCGYVSLFAAIVQTEIPPEMGIGSNPWDIRYGWTWLARVTNMRPRNITCALLASFLDIAGFELHLRYKRQFFKLLKVLLNDVIPAVPSSAPAGPKTRLQTFLQEYIQSGTLNPPQGKYLPASDAENVDTSSNKRY